MNYYTMNYQEPNGRFLSGKWYAATIIGCLIMPIGLLLCVINTVLDFRSCNRKNRAVLYSGIGVAIYSVVMTSIILSVSIEANAFSVALPLWYAAPSLLAVYLFVVYAVHTLRCKRLNLIFFLIQTEHITSIQRLAEISGMSVEKTVKSIVLLIKKGRLGDAEISKNKKEVVLKNSIWAKQKVVCRTCGAEIPVDFGQTLVCEYCGGALETYK